MSESFEQIDSVRVFFKDGSCAFLKNHGLNVNAVITQLTEERAALAAENERLRKAGEWQPINTAPKDGTDILIRVIMRWDKDAKGWAYFQNPATNAEWMPLVNAAKEGRDAK